MTRTSPHWFATAGDRACATMHLGLQKMRRTVEIVSLDPHRQARLGDITLARFFWARPFSRKLHVYRVVATSWEVGERVT